MEEESELGREDLLALIESARQLGGELSLEAVLHRILERAGALTDSPAASVILRNEERDTLYMAAATGPDAEWVLTTFGFFSEKQIPLKESKAGEVFRSGESIVENAVRGHFKGVDAETEKPTESLVCVPLTVGGEPLGVMQMLNKQSGDYTKRDRALLESFAVQAAMAIRNARLIEGLGAHSGLSETQRSSFDIMAELRKPAHREDLTVLFADLRGSTQLFQSIQDPVVTQSLLNEFLAMLADTVSKHSGTVNKFMGDGVMALFRGGNFAERAVFCAADMVEEFPKMLDRWNDDSNQQLDFLDIGVGIVTDNVVLGGIGSFQVRDFTAIGVAVNMAAMLEQDARNGRRILVDQRTYNRARSVIKDADGPEDFVLQKPGQAFGIKNKRYCLNSISIEKEARVFISHDHEDRAFVEAELVEPLKNNEIDTWYSASDIEKGASWTAEIRKALFDCTWMVVVISEHSAGSRWVRREVDLAVAAGHMEGRIIPVIIDGTELVGVNEYLIDMQGIDAKSEKNVSELLAARVLARRAPREG